ncbi:MerR family transcriptional regulator [Paenibacillus sp. CMAA1364]
MNNRNKSIFTSGQFAKLHHINKRTLHYYDDIGLFSPSHKGDNGYRYYTYLQSPVLELLLTMRELNMSIEEISTYMSDRSIPAFRSIIDTKTAEIDDTIKRLKTIRNLLVEKEKLLTLCEQPNLDHIEIIECIEEHLLLNRYISGISEDEQDFIDLVEHTQTFRDHRLFNTNYGSMISVEKIMSGNFEEYDYLFAKIVKKNKKLDLFIKPKGNYIRAFCKGDWDSLPETYDRIIQFATANGLTLIGYAFEEGINEMAVNTMDDYVTQIMILCE